MVPAEYAEIGRQLGEVGVLDVSETSRLVLMARYRNRMVHFYNEMMDAELFTVLSTKLRDIEGVVAGITRWMVAHPERVADGE